MDFHNRKGALAVTGILPPVHNDTGIGNKIPFAQIVDGGGLCRQMKVEVAFQYQNMIIGKLSPILPMQIMAQYVILISNCSSVFRQQGF